MRIRTRQPPQPAAVLVALAGIAIAVMLAGLACWAWERSFAGPGERSLDARRVWTARSAAMGLSAAAQTVLFGIAIPLVYRFRPIYLAVAVVAGILATAGLIATAALALAGR